MRISDWSSDVCSSDLVEVVRVLAQILRHAPLGVLHVAAKPEDAVARDSLGREPHAVQLECGAGLVEVARLEDRKSVVEGKSVSVRVDLGWRRIIKKKTRKTLQM